MPQVVNGQLVTIVMYHYVRDLKNSRYPEIKGLTAHNFLGQIQYFGRHYNVISAHQLMDAVLDGAPLPPRSLLLTFDDGYIDHFNVVFPILDRENMPECFFPPARCVLEHDVLEVNKIHFLLASVADKSILVNYILKAVVANQSTYQLQSADYYWETQAEPSRFDGAEVVFCKRMLQRELPLELRQCLIDDLFAQFVSTDETSFSRELYMNEDQLQMMQRQNMYIGSHGHGHFWLNTITPDEQATEIDLSMEFLSRLGTDLNRWIMCYPYGAYDESLLALLKARNCAVGLTTVVDLASLEQENPLTLPRLDTNDLPLSADAELCQWTERVLEH
jgi:peptidoglycan/xylan/chitin deacetylase (PgdA/CDA1 family)